jgi:hypothetical protein
MSERLTVVFDDAALYRRLKVYAAEHDLPLKHVIERAVRQYLGPAAEDAATKPFDWDAYDRWQAEVAAMEAELGDGEPDDYADVKRHLYPVGDEHRPARLLIAEERKPYDA